MHRFSIPANRYPDHLDNMHRFSIPANRCPYHLDNMHRFSIPANRCPDHLINMHRFSILVLIIYRNRRMTRVNCLQSAKSRNCRTIRGKCPPSYWVYTAWRRITRDLFDAFLRADLEVGHGVLTPNPPEKSQVVICFYGFSSRTSFFSRMVRATL